jgi:hypothetical protein
MTSDAERWWAPRLSAFAHSSVQFRRDIAISFV